MWIVILWVVFSFLVAAGARNRGRSGFCWFVLAAVISPVLAGLALLLVGSRREITR